MNSWLIDYGNTRLKCAPLDADGRCGPVQAFSASDLEALDGLLRILGEAKTGDRVWLASVATPERTDALALAIAGQGYAVRRVQTKAQCGRLRIAYDEPLRLGVDRFLAMLTVLQRDDGPWLIVSVGSALTVDLLDVDGRHHGGLIAPTPTHMHEMLTARFPQLDMADGHAVDFADDTADAVASGIRAAALGLIERSVRTAQERLAVPPTLLLTGGGAEKLHAALGGIYLAAPVLDGLAIFAGIVEN
jgi:type III pantothenate kinase